MEVADDRPGFDFVLPPELEAGEPPEARGMERDGVRLMVSRRFDDRINHVLFRDIGDFLRSGDVLAVNTSGTRNAALTATRADGTVLELHLSTHLPDGRWSVELRLPVDHGTAPFLTALPGEVLSLPGGASIRLLEPYARFAAPAQAQLARFAAPERVRLWRAELSAAGSPDDYLARWGFPIRYGYVHDPWPSEYYQTVFATEIGSAEMPSAGRAFTPDLVTRLVSRGVQFAPLLLHTGVASLEDHEPPYAEYYRVPEETARIVTEARRDGRRVIAVGTTVIRALETVTDAGGVTHPGEGWTDIVVTPIRGIRSADGLLTGFHEPRATHLMMLEALVDRPRLRAAYREALRERYLWHEFGDLHLILPGSG
jgi:S-adenosylmethionine:tRNA ribosyltransferase-isomerase